MAKANGATCSELLVVQASRANDCSALIFLWSCGTIPRTLSIPNTDEKTRDFSVILIFLRTIALIRPPAIPCPDEMKSYQATVGEAAPYGQWPRTEDHCTASGWCYSSSAVTDSPSVTHPHPHRRIISATAASILIGTWWECMTCLPAPRWKKGIV